MMPNTVKTICGKLATTDLCDKLTACAALQHQFKGIFATENLQTREELWDFAIAKIGKEKKVLFMEFGVWEGYSIKYFSTRLANAGSRFIGCDSFEGLPEKWGTIDREVFSTGGNIPQIKDSRVSFVKGWFQNTFDQAVKVGRELAPGCEEVLIHFDADIYSSSLFLLSRLHQEFDSYYFIFDEFMGHETRALLNFQQAYGAKVQFYGRCRDDAPIQVFGRLENNRGKYHPA